MSAVGAMPVGVPGAVLVAVLVAVLTGCAGPADDRTVTVLAASSLADVVSGLARRYEADHPGSTVRVTPGGSSDLVTQLAGGLPADVLATADERTMTSARQQGLVTDPTPLATNRLVLATAPGNPLRLATLADAGAHDLVVCAPSVPCGAATARVAAAEGAALHARSEEQNVTAVLEKVRSGQADAGVVYRTDARRAGASIAAVPLPGAEQVVVRQLAAATPGASPDGVAFLRLLTGREGRAALERAGFGRL